MDILISIAGKIAEYIVTPIGRQVGYLIFYKDNLKELKDQVKELKRIKESIEHDVEAQRRNGKEIEGVVQNWLSKVDEIMDVAKQLAEDPRCRKARCSKWSFPNLKSRHQLSRNAKKMARDVNEMQGKGKFDRIGYLPSLTVVGSTSTTTREAGKLESRESMKEDIVLALKDLRISKIGVYGLGGVGKTTLVEEVAKQVAEDKLFDVALMAYVTRTPDPERIQTEIADNLGLHFEEKTIIVRAKRLCERIKQEKSILIILDDIWEVLDLEKLGIPSQDDHKGCKLLLTSRNQDILQKMGIQKDFRLNILNGQETWKLFEHMVGDYVEDANLHSIATKVARQCAGLPVLVVAVAKALKNKDIYYWEEALNKLLVADNQDVNDIIYSALEISYNYLEGDEVKALFLLLGILGSKLQIRYLEKIVMGLGIFSHINTVKDARLRLFTWIGSLKASCLLLDSNKKEKVKMHDTVREVALRIASRDQLAFHKEKSVELKEWPTQDLFHYIILNWCDIHELPESLECPKVNFFCLINKNRSLGIPDSFFEGMRNLKVIDLTNVHLSSLPKSFCFLINLQTLCLHHCSLGNMTDIGALKKLQILSFYGSSMTRLPGELGQLTLLRMLDLTHSGIEIFPSNIISKLTKLEELYMGNTSIKWQPEKSVEENENATLAELKHLTNLTALEIQIQGAWILPGEIMFEKLERYKIVVGDVWEWSDNYGSLKMLKIKLGTSIHLEYGIKELIKGVEDLYLDEIDGISNVLYHLSADGFPLLKHLHIQNNAKIQHIVNSMERNRTQVFFPILETLILQNLCHLEKICHGPHAVNSFGKLKVIKVENCDRLEYLFSVLILKALSQLLEIDVFACSCMKKIVFVENGDSGVTIEDEIMFHSLQSLTLRNLPMVDKFYSNELTSSITSEKNSSRIIPTSFFDAKVKFFNLETLQLSSMNFEKIWDDELSVAYSFCNLASLIVKDCSNLKYLFSPSMIESFQNLKRIEISGCDMMEEIIAIKGQNGTALEEVWFSNLEIIIIDNMKSLKKVWHCQFHGLKTLEVSNCEKLENIFPAYIQGTFGSLLTLKVSDCGSLKEVFELSTSEIQSEEDRTAYLKKLHLLRLPKLKQIWSKDPQGILFFHNLQDVHVEHCGNIEYLFPFSIATGLLQLEKLHMDSCGMKEIVAKKEGPIEGHALFDFHQLYSLVMWDMDNLDRLYDGTHILVCPSLKVLRVYNCKKLKLFERRCRINQRKDSDSETHVSSQQPLFIVEEVISGLEELNLRNEDAMMILQDQQWRDHFRKLKILRLYNINDKQATTFLDSVLQKAPNLEVLTICESSLKEMFREERFTGKEVKNEISIQVRHLNLIELELQHICREGYQIDPILEVLEGLYVKQCTSLRNLFPSSVTLSHLTYLEVKECHKLISLISLSTARSLVNLGWMAIKECNSLEEMVTQEVNDETEDEIVFISLEVLELQCLPMLHSFSSTKCPFKFPSLKKVVVRQCPKMKIFSTSETSTPMLRKVLKEENGEAWCWEGNLNATIRKMCPDEVIQEGDDGNVSESSQSIQKTISTTRTLSLEEQEKQSRQEGHKLSSFSYEREQKEHASSADCPDIEAQKMCEIIERPVIHAGQNETIFTTIQDTAIEAQEISEVIGRPLAIATQNTVSSTTGHSTAIETQELHETILSPLVPIVQKALSPTTIQDRAAGALTSSCLASDASISYKGMLEICLQNLAYLEAGLKLHPQVHDWLNTKRRRVFASIFAEVTRILRTTRRGDLTEEERNYIRECCSSLEVVGFDASWLSYIKECLEECDDRENLQRKLEDTETKAFNLKKELASVEASLVLLRDKVRRLDDFIES